MSNDDDSVSARWQDLYDAHFHLPPIPSNNPSCAPLPHLPRFFFSSTPLPTDDPSLSPLPTAFRCAVLHAHLQREADALLDDADLSAVFQALTSSAHSASSSLSSSFSASSVTATSLSLSLSALLPSPLEVPLSYPAFLALSQAVPLAKRAVFSARTYSLFPRLPQSPSAISPRLLILHLLYAATTARLRLSLSAYDELSTGHLREEDLMNWVFDDMKAVPALRGVEAAFAPYFVFTVVRKVLFFMDAGKRGRIRVRDLAHSSLMHEWEHRKQQPEPAASGDPAPAASPLDAAQSHSAEASLGQLKAALVQAAASASAAGELTVGASSLSSSLSSCTDPGRVSAASTARPCWFSLLNSQAVYGLYLSLDRNQNGMLDRAELVAFHGGSFTSALMDALFFTLPLYPGDAGVLEMDYKAFLDFVLALEYPHSPASLGYFFALLDFQKVGYLDRASVSYWFRHVRSKMAELGHEAIPSCDVMCDEVMDMLSPLEKEGRIGLKDLIRSRCGHTVVSILTDVNGFWKYDHRETLMAQQQQQSQT